MLFLISSTGHGWREIEDEWDFPRLQRWLKYCEEKPPLREMVAAYLGYGKSVSREFTMKVTEENFSDFLKKLQSEGATGG
jgi:hypothetical protein